MSERLHYFTEASTTVSFDCSDSDIDSDIDDLTRRPVSESDRAKQHARQLQLWSDEARRRRSPAQAPSSSPHRRPSSASLHDALPPSLAQTSLSGPATPSKVASPELRTRQSGDRQQSNLSERNRVPNSNRVTRSQSAKNLRIRITPSSSSKSLLSDIESEVGNSLSAPQSPRGAMPDPKSANDKPLPVPISITIGEGQPSKSEGEDPIQEPKEAESSNPPDNPTLTADSKPDPNTINEKTSNEENAADRARTNLSRRLSLAMRGKRLPSLRKLWRR